MLSDSQIVTVGWEILDAQDLAVFAEEARVVNAQLLSHGYPFDCYLLLVLLGFELQRQR